MALMDSLLTCKIAAPEDVHGRHVRAARTLLDWTKAHAAKECGVGVNTIGRFEEGSGKLTARTVADIVRTFESAGIVFVEGEVGSGVLLKRSSSKA
jgi:transcriptional regulator with XRE-family HTH domain